MVAILLALLLVALLFGGGFAYSVLWIIAAVLLVVWLAGFVVRPGTGGGRWYYW